VSPTETRYEKAARDLEWPALVERIAAKCASEAGARRVRALVPAATRDDAILRGTRSRDALELYLEGETIPVAAVPDVSEVVDRVARGSVATGRELRDLRRMLDAGRALRGFAKQHADRVELAKVLDTDGALDKLLEEIVFAVDDDGDVFDRASAELGRARKKVEVARRELTGRLSELLNRYADVLRDRFYTERDGRYVLPIRADAPFRVDGIVLGSSASGGTLYVEPREVTEIGNRLKMAEAEVEREIARVLGALSISVRAHTDGLGAAIEACTAADVLATLARFGAETDAVVLLVDDGAELDLRDMRHPLLVGTGPVVANDVRAVAGRGLVISGPNAGGKTVALKCLGLATWMVRAGIPLPVDPKSRIGWFEPVLTDIGDEQSLARSLSTFSAHAAHLADYLDRAAPGTLVLLDEVAAGTDPDEGAALATAVLEGFVEAGAAVAVTTHYERLKELGASDPRFDNASVGFDFDTMRPTFKVTMGIPGASSALAVAARYGVPERIVKRAEALLPEENARKKELLRAIETDRTRAEADRRAAEADARAQHELRAELEVEVGRARATEKTRLEGERRELVSAVREARASLRNATERLNKGDVGRDELREVAKSVNRAASAGALGSALHESLDGGSAKSGPAIVASELKPGDVVTVPRLGLRAEVLEAPVRGQVRIAAGPMKLTVKLDELVRAPHGAQPTRPKSPKKTAAPPVRIDSTPVRTPSITCDVRGLRVEEATDRIEAFIDGLLSSGEPAGFILHGHGTGALKSAIREQLKAHRFVERSRAADAEDGGDAFTVLWIAG